MSKKLLTSKDLEIKISLSDYLTEDQMDLVMSKLVSSFESLMNQDGETIEVIYHEYETYDNEFEEELE